MSVRGSLNPGDSLVVSTYAELLYFKRNDSYSITPTREYVLKIYRHHHLLFKSTPIVWTENGLNQAIAKVDLVFPTHPKGLVFVISVTELVRGRGVRMEVNINSLISSTFGKTKSQNGERRGKFSAHRSTVRAVSLEAYATSQSFTRKSVASTSSRKGLSVISTVNLYPRTRSKTFTVHQYSGFNPVGTTTTSTYPSLFLTRNSVRTPGFRAKAKVGALPLNPYSMLIQRAEGGALSIHKSFINGNFGHTDTNAMVYSGLTDIPANHLSMDENRLISKIAGRVNASDSNIPEDIAQARQTINLFTSNVNRLRSFSKLGSGGSLASVLKDLGAPGSKQAFRTYSSLTRNGVYSARILSEMWLELRYGWLPLIKDIEGSIATFSQYLVRNRGLVSVSGQIRKLQDIEVPITGVTADGSQNGSKYTHTVTAVRMKLWYNVDAPVVAAFAQLGFTSPVALAWELIPFSFVVDWFLPIGNALQLFHSFDGLSFHKGFKTYFTRQYCTVSLTGGTEPPYDAVNIDGMAFLEGVRVNRTVLTDFPTPNFPRWKNPLSVLHAANAVALLVQGFTSK